MFDFATVSSARSRAVASPITGNDHSPRLVARPLMWSLLTQTFDSGPLVMRRTRSVSA